MRDTHVSPAKNSKVCNGLIELKLSRCTRNRHKCLTRETFVSHHRLGEERIEILCFASKR
jgi:hypothetical protein